MATRSYIGKLNSDNTVTYIYCHWDGYPSNNGVILQEHYNTPKQIDELLVLGDMSSLGVTSETCNLYEEHNGGSITLVENFNTDFYIDYFYLFTDEGWKVSVYGSEWKLLEEILQPAK